MITVRSPWNDMGLHLLRDGGKRPIFGTVLNLFPIRIVHQALFAEAFSQALDSGMEVNAAIETAALTCKSRRFRHAILNMSAYVRTGETLANGLSKSGVRTSKLFRASLSVGENRGRLAEELAAFARSYATDIADRLARSVGRSPQVTRFITALSRLLNDHGLTMGIIEDASTMAAGKGSHFDHAIVAVIEDMQSGESFSRSMHRQSPIFDRFLCSLVAASTGRDALCRTLMRMCDLPRNNRER